MISFYPGPSQVYNKVPDYVRDAYRSGILGVNHRSPQFTDLSRETIELLQRKLGVPADYTVFFISSATEAWEIIAQSLIREKSIHVFNGSFGAKWHRYTKHIHPDSIGIRFNEQTPLSVEDIHIYEDFELLALTHCETSNSTFIRQDRLREVRSAFKDSLIAVDATSTLGGLSIDYTVADIWFASVQKCLGLPAGMALMICSPAAIERALMIGEKGRYNSLTLLIQHMKKHQTSYTPNVLSIYLLNRVLKDRPGIARIDSKLRKRARLINVMLDNMNDFFFYISDETLRSPTVAMLKSSEILIEEIKAEALKAGYLLGNGYGDLKPYTLRIANFPAVKKSQLKQLLNFLSENYQ